MILIGLKINIKNFWACEISRAFPECKFKVIDISPVKDHSRAILETNCDISKIINFLKKQKIKNINVLINEKGNKLIALNFSHGPLANILIKTNLYIRPPLFLEKSHIFVNLIGNESNIKNFLKKAKMEKDVSMQLLKKSSLKYFQKSKLTDKQEYIIRNAIELGFYDVPRKINIKELAKKLKIAPSTLSEHLRKTEERVIKDYF